MHLRSTGPWTVRKFRSDQLCSFVHSQEQGVMDSLRHGAIGVQLLNYFPSRSETAMQVEGVRHIRRLVLDDVLDVDVGREAEAVVHGENL